MRHARSLAAALLLLGLPAHAQFAYPPSYYNNLLKECDERGGGACCRGAVEDMRAAKASPAAENGYCLDGHTIVKPPCPWAIPWCKPGPDAAKLTRVRLSDPRLRGLGPWESVGSYRGTVLKVSAPDELVVLQNKVHRHRIVLRGVKAPKRSSPHYLSALRLARKLVEGKEVLVENFSDSASGARCSTVVFNNETFLSDALAAAGLVRWDSKADPVNRSLSDAEAAAKKAGKGLWAGR